MNLCRFYAVDDQGHVEPLQSQPRAYAGTIDDFQLNSDYAAVKCGKKVQLHMVESSDEEAEGVQESRMFPEKDSDAITSMALTSAFFIYATKQGGIHYFLLEDWKFVNNYSHACGIRYIKADNSGTRLVCIDDKGDGLLYNPINDAVRRDCGLARTEGWGCYDVS